MYLVREKGDETAGQAAGQVRSQKRAPEQLHDSRDGWCVTAAARRNSQACQRRVHGRVGQVRYPEPVRVVAAQARAASLVHPGDKTSIVREARCQFRCRHRRAGDKAEGARPGSVRGTRERTRRRRAADNAPVISDIGTL